MKEILNKYVKWKIENPDTDYQYDEIHDFVSGVLCRSDLYEIMEYLLQTYENK